MVERLHAVVRLRKCTHYIRFLRLKKRINWPKTVLSVVVISRRAFLSTFLSFLFCFSFSLSTLNCSKRFYRKMWVLLQCTLYKRNEFFPYLNEIQLKFRHEFLFTNCDGYAHFFLKSMRELATFFMRVACTDSHRFCWTRDEKLVFSSSLNLDALSPFFLIPF